MPQVKRIDLISDSTGELSERFTNALITQFPKHSIQIAKHPFVDSRQAVQQIIHNLPQGKRQSHALFHTVLSPALKKDIARACSRRKIPVFDLTGPPTDFLVQSLQLKPKWNLRTIHRIDQAYDKRIEAIEFTLGHDDGAGEASLTKAEAILVGPSRVSKTPTSVYLALKGFRVANISIIRELGEPESLARLDGDSRTVGFIIDPLKLYEVRKKRSQELGIEPERYLDLREIHREVSWAREVYRKYRWKTVDVTDRAIEETAAIVMRTIQRKKGEQKEGGE